MVEAVVASQFFAYLSEQLVPGLADVTDPDTLFPFTTLFR